MQDTITLQNIIDQAIEDLYDRYENYRDDFYQGEPHDVIAEIADGAVPVYYSDLLDLASQNNSLATDEPELGPAFDGSPTPVNIIAANVYETVSNAMFDAWQDVQDSAEGDSD